MASIPADTGIVNMVKILNTSKTDTDVAKSETATIMLDATKRRLAEFLKRHTGHGWVLITDRTKLKFPSIALTHDEYDCPCNPGYHFTVKRLPTPSTPST